MIQKLDTGIVWYLSHPCTSLGKIQENYQAEAQAHMNIMISQQGEAYYINAAQNRLKVMRPVTLVPGACGHDEAMEMCLAWLEGCGGIIMAGDWQNSKGCKIEKEYAQKWGKQVAYYPDIVLAGVEK